MCKRTWIELNVDEYVEKKGGCYGGVWGRKEVLRARGRVEKMESGRKQKNRMQGGKRGGER